MTFINLTQFKKYAIRNGLIAFSLIVLTACGGGGGGGGGNNSSTPTANIGAGFNKAKGFSGTVNSIVATSDGSGDIYVGGQFSSYNSTAVNRLVRLNSDGTIDTTFDSLSRGGFDNAVNSIAAATDGSGDIYVGGWFLSYNGTTVNQLVRLNSDGTIDTAFDSLSGGGFDNAVNSIAAATDGSGDIYVGGWFLSYNGTTVNQLVRLNSDGTIDTAFDSLSGGGFNGRFNGVTSLVAATDGSGDIYVGGDFTTYNGTAVNSLVRLNSDGTIDTAFDSLSRGGFDNDVSSIAAATDGSGDIYVGGWFLSYNGTTVNSLVRLNSDGTIDTAFDSLSGGGFNHVVNSLVAATDGTGDIYVGGRFSSYNSTAVNRLVRLNSDGTIDTAFDSLSHGGFDNAINSIAAATDGSGDIYVGGWFSTYNGTAVNRLVRLNSNGTMDAVNNIGAGFNDKVQTLVTATDGSGDIYVGGDFTTYNGTAVNSLVRLTSDGTIDAAFDSLSAGGFDYTVASIVTATDGSGDIYVGGNFTTYSGTSVNRLVRLNSDGTLDTAFDSLSGGGFNHVVNSLVVATDGSGDIYVGGNFTTYSGTSVNRLVRLNSDGTLDTAFDSLSRGGFDNAVNSLVAVTDGSGDIYVGGNFTTYSGTSVNRLVRLNSDGTLDTAFDTLSGGGFSGASLSTSVISLVAATDGSGDIYVGGWFSTYNGTTVNRLVRLNSDGTIDTAFDSLSGGGFNHVVNSLIAASDGSGDIYVGGQFSSYNSTTVNCLVRLNKDGTIDTAFDSLSGGGFNVQFNGVTSLLAATDGSDDIFAGGYFGSYKGTTVDTMVRLNPDGTLN